MAKKNFQDITGKSYVALPAGYGIEGAFPIDLRTVLPNEAMLEALIHRGMAYEGMLVYIGVGSGTGVIHICKQKFHSATWYANGDIAASMSKYYTDEDLTIPVTQSTADGSTVYSNWLWHEEYQVSSSSVETATKAAKLDHNVTINGKPTNFEGEISIDTGLFTPEEIDDETNIDTITHCGHYTYTDTENDANNYSLLIQQIGDKLYRTKISIDSNGVPVIETSVGIPAAGTITWSNWTKLAVGKSITTVTSQILGTATLPDRVVLNIEIGSTPEMWLYSAPNTSYPTGYANIHTADGQVFTIGSQSAIIEHPFLVKLVNDNGTRTATVESLKANGSNFGMVKLLDSISSDSGAGAGVAATPASVKNVQSNLTNHESVKGNASTFGHVKLSDATNSDSAASANVAATPKAVKTVQANLTDHTNTKGNGNTYGHVKLSDATDSNSAASANIAATPKAVKDAVAKVSGGGIYHATYSSAVASGDISATIEEQSAEFNVGDIIVLRNTTAQPTQQGVKSIKLNNIYYTGISDTALPANSIQIYTIKNGNIVSRINTQITPNLISLLKGLADFISILGVSPKISVYFAHIIMKRPLVATFEKILGEDISLSASYHGGTPTVNDKADYVVDITVPHTANQVYREMYFIQPVSCTSYLTVKGITPPNVRRNNSTSSASCLITVNTSLNTVLEECFDFAALIIRYKP